MTSRLELRPFRPEDAAELHEIFSDPETHAVGEGPLASLAETAAWISRRAEAERQHGLLWYAVRDRAGGRMLGNCGLFAGRTGSAEPEIGYEIRRSCQGQGLATGAARAVLDDALASGISRVWATIRPQRRVPARRGQDRDDPPAHQAGQPRPAGLPRPPVTRPKYPEGRTPGKLVRPCGPHRRARPSRPQACVRVHVMPAVGQEPGAAAHALRGEACLIGHAAKGPASDH